MTDKWLSELMGGDSRGWVGGHGGNSVAQHIPTDERLRRYGNGGETIAQRGKPTRVHRGEGVEGRMTQKHLYR